MRAVVLGAGGFLGSHLCRRLVADGWDVTGTVRDVEAPHVVRRLDGVRDDIRLRRGDVVDPELLASVVVGADAVFPFAGRSGAARSLDDPVVDAQVNGLGQLRLLEALRDRNPDARVVFPGSRLQYGRVATLPVPEDHPLEPTSAYGIHKLLGEQYHLLYARQFGIRSTSLRISLPYGPEQDRADDAFGVVGTFLARAAAGEAIQLYGGGEQLRDYVFVDDLVDLCVRLTDDGDRTVGLALNAGGPTATSLRTMAETVVEVVGRGTVEAVPWPAEAARVETGDYHGDLTRVRELVGWEPTTSLADGLAVTWERSRPEIEARITA